MTRPVIFLSYSHKDEKLKERLMSYLGELRSAGIHLWSDDLIPVGSGWGDEIDRALDGARVAILLVTKNFLTSDFIRDTEVPKIIERREAAGVTILPLIAKRCAWRNVPWLAAIQAWPKDGGTVWGRERDTEGLLTEFTAEVRAVIGAGRRGPLDASARARLEAARAAGLKAVKERSQALEEKGQRLENREGPLTLDDVCALVSLALEHGIPLYNGGNREGCAEIYLSAAGLLSDLLMWELDAMLNPWAETFDAMEEVFEAMTSKPPRKPGPGVSPGRQRALLRMAYEELVLVLDKTGRRDGGDAIETAKAVRNVFDCIHKVSKAAAAIDSVPHPAADTREARARHILDVVAKTTSSSIMLHNEGVRRSKDWIRACCAVYLYAAHGLLPHLTEPEAAPARDIITKRLYESDYYTFTNSVSDVPGEKRVYETAWDIRHAFDLLVMNLG